MTGWGSFSPLAGAVLSGATPPTQHVGQWTAMRCARAIKRAMTSAAGTLAMGTAMHFASSVRLVWQCARADSCANVRYSQAGMTVLQTSAAGVLRTWIGHCCILNLFPAERSLTYEAFISSPHTRGH